jgi:glycosyltransferase involved in cell wall biosynthesis
MRLLNYYTPFFTKVRFFLGALRRREIRFYGTYHFEEDVDYKITSSADACVSPSASLADILTKEWRLNRGKVSVIPYPFTPPAKLLNVPIVIRHTKVVSFIGKLNVHKGIVALVDAIKKLIKKHPDVTFRLIGNDSYYTVSKMSMSDYIRKKLSGYEKNFLIRGGLDYEEIMYELSLADVCVFPSIWENFPNVCLEAMSAGRAIVGSKNGGMSEILSDDCGVIIDPLDSGEIAEEISVLLQNPARRVAYGEKARAAILQLYNKERIGGLLEEHYEKVIADAC